MEEPRFAVLPVPERLAYAGAQCRNDEVRRARKVGLTRERLSRALSEPHIADHLRQRAARTRASARLIALLDAKSEHVSADVARHLLAISDIAPKGNGTSLNVNLSIRAGYVIDLSEESQPRLRGKTSPGQPGDIIIGIIGGPEPAALPASADE